MTYSEQSFSSLGLTPGAYTWTWRSSRAYCRTDLE